MKLPFAGRLLAAAVLAAASAALPISSAFADDSAAKPKVGLVMKSLANEFFGGLETYASGFPNVEVVLRSVVRKTGWNIDRMCMTSTSLPVVLEND